MEKKQQGNIFAIVIMFFLFAMISFVTGFQNPFGVIVKQQFAASNFMSQLGNAANFIAYAFMGLPAGMILSKKGYKFTALAAVTVGFVGVGITFLSGIAGSFAVYLLGAFISGFSMCMLNTVVNPMLNTLGGGGNKGNQLIQWGGSCNSLSATIVPVLVGYLIGDVTKDTQIADAIRRSSSRWAFSLWRSSSSRPRIFLNLSLRRLLLPERRSNSPSARASREPSPSSISCLVSSPYSSMWVSR